MLNIKVTNRMSHEDFVALTQASPYILPKRHIIAVTATIVLCTALVLVGAFCHGRSLPAEVCIALFQHYEVVVTPFTDITQSLRAAATFAFRSS